MRTSDKEGYTDARWNRRRTQSLRTGIDRNPPRYPSSSRDRVRGDANREDRRRSLALVGNRRRRGRRQGYGDTLPIPLSIVGFGPLFRGFGPRPVRASRQMRAKARPTPVLRALRAAPGSFCEKRREPTNPPWACRRAAPRRRSAFSDIVRRRRHVSDGPAIRLGRYFGVDPRFWLNLQPRTIFRVPRARRTIPACAPEPTLALSS